MVPLWVVVDTSSSGMSKKAGEETAEKNGVLPLSRVLSLKSKLTKWRPFLWDQRCRWPRTPYPEVQTVRAAPFLPIWAFSQWGLPCHACHQPRGALLPHPFTLTGDRSRLGGLLSVALSLGLPPVAVSHHCALWSPDFPRTSSKPSSAAALATLRWHSSPA